MFITKFENSAPMRYMYNIIYRQKVRLSFLIRGPNFFYSFPSKAILKTKMNVIRSTISTYF